MDIIETKDITHQALPEIPEYFIHISSLIVQSYLSGSISRDRLYTVLMEHIDGFNEFVKTFTVCSKGCSSCCYIGVRLTIFEAEIIQDQVFNKGILKGKSLAIMQDKLLNGVKPCVFLDINGTCSIYEYRPFTCRSFHTVDDPAYCADQNKLHILYGAYQHTLDGPTFNNHIYDNAYNILSHFSKNKEVILHEFFRENDVLRCT